MARPSAFLFSSLILTILFAGCAGSSADSVGAAPSTSSVVMPAEPEENGGTIEGLVVDDEQNPIKGASVGLVELKLEAATAADGSFAFQQIPAGRYQVAAGALGYDSSAKYVEIAEGEVKSVILSLVKLAIEEGFHHTQKKDGFLACGFAVRPGTAVEPCAFFSGTGTAIDDLEQFIVDFDPTVGRSTNLSMFIFETVWVPSQVLSKGLDVLWENYRSSGGPGLSVCPCLTFGSVHGTSPLRLEIEKDTIKKVIDGNSPHCMKTGPCRVRARAFPYADAMGPSSPVDLAVYVNQRFTAIATEFYVEPAPANFTATS